MEAIRCRMCGATAEGDREFAIKYFQHREAEKARRVKGPMVYICPRCSGRAQYEADRELRGKGE